jgi:hypothetical protein
MKQPIHNLSSVLQDLCDYYDKTRGIGHTGMMTHGAASFANPIFVFKTEYQARDSAKALKFNGLTGKCMGLDEFRNHAFMPPGPMAIDNGLLKDIFETSRKTIRSLGEKNKELEESVQSLKQRNYDLTRSNERFSEECRRLAQKNGQLTNESERLKHKLAAIHSFSNHDAR